MHSNKTWLKMRSDKIQHNTIWKTFVAWEGGKLQNLHILYQHIKLAFLSFNHLCLNTTFRCLLHPTTCHFSPLSTLQIASLTNTVIDLILIRKYCFVLSLLDKNLSFCLSDIALSCELNTGQGNQNWWEWEKLYRLCYHLAMLTEKEKKKRSWFSSNDYKQAQKLTIRTCLTHRQLGRWWTMILQSTASHDFFQQWYNPHNINKNTNSSLLKWILRGIQTCLFLSDHFLDPLADLPADQMLIVLQVVVWQDLTLVCAWHNPVERRQTVTLLQEASPQHFDATLCPQPFFDAMSVDALPGAGSVVDLSSATRLHHTRCAGGEEWCAGGGNQPCWWWRKGAGLAYERSTAAESLHAAASQRTGAGSNSVR